MENKKLMDSILNFIPLMHTKLFKEFRHHKVQGHNNRILYIVMRHEGHKMSYYCDLLSISKPNFTKAANRLIDEGLLVRQADTRDRRKIRLYITDQGKNMITQKREEMKLKLTNRLNSLSKEDIDKLTESFESIERILNRLED